MMARPPRARSSWVAWVCLPLLACCVARASAAGYAMDDDSIREAVGERTSSKGSRRADDAEKEYGGINTWDTSAVKTTQHLFKGKAEFNEDIDIDSWQMGSVTDVNHVFWLAKKFNQPMNSWQMSLVTDFGGMFSPTDRFGPCSNCQGLPGVNCTQDPRRTQTGHWWRFETLQMQAEHTAFAENLELFYYNYNCNYNYNYNYNRSLSSYTGNLPPIYPCPKKETCLGGINSACRAGTTGTTSPLCEVCAAGHFRFDGDCTRCSESTMGSAVASLAITCLVVAAGFFMQRARPAGQVVVLAMSLALTLLAHAAIAATTFDNSGLNDAIMLYCENPTAAEVRAIAMPRARRPPPFRTCVCARAQRPRKPKTRVMTRTNAQL